MIRKSPKALMHGRAIAPCEEAVVHVGGASALARAQKQDVVSVGAIADAMAGLPSWVLPSSLGAIVGASIGWIAGLGPVWIGAGAAGGAIAGAAGQYVYESLASSPCPDMNSPAFQAQIASINTGMMSASTAENFAKGYDATCPAVAAAIRAAAVGAPKTPMTKLPSGLTPGPKTTTPVSFTGPGAAKPGSGPIGGVTTPSTLPPPAYGSTVSYTLSAEDASQPVEDFIGLAGYLDIGDFLADNPTIAVSAPAYTSTGAGGWPPDSVIPYWQTGGSTGVDFVETFTPTGRIAPKPWSAPTYTSSWRSGEFVFYPWTSYTYDGSTGRYNGPDPTPVSSSGGERIGSQGVWVWDAGLVVQIKPSSSLVSTSGVAVGAAIDGSTNAAPSWLAPATIGAVAGAAIGFIAGLGTVLIAGSAAAGAGAGILYAEASNPAQGPLAQPATTTTPAGPTATLPATYVLTEDDVEEGPPGFAMRAGYPSVEAFVAAQTPGTFSIQPVTPPDPSAIVAFLSDHSIFVEASPGSPASVIYKRVVPWSAGIAVIVETPVTTSGVSVGRRRAPKKTKHATSVGATSTPPETIINRSLTAAEMKSLSACMRRKGAAADASALDARKTPLTLYEVMADIARYNRQMQSRYASHADVLEYQSTISCLQGAIAVPTSAARVGASMSYQSAAATRAIKCLSALSSSRQWDPQWAPIIAWLKAALAADSEAAITAYLKAGPPKGAGFVMSKAISGDAMSNTINSCLVGYLLTMQKRVNPGPMVAGKARRAA